MSVEALQQQFDAHRAQLPGKGDADERRAEALARFVAGGFPSRHDEHWHYTDLRALQAERFNLVPAAPSAAARGIVQAALAEQGLGGARPRLVFIDGHYDETLSDSLESGGILVENLATAGPAEPDAAAASAASRPGPPLALLNSAFSAQGVRLHAARGYRAGAPVDLVFVGSGAPGQAPQPRVVIALEENAEVEIVQHFLGDSAASGWLNLVVEVAQAAGSHLTLYRLQEEGPRQFHTALLRARLARDAELTMGYVDIGGRLVRNEIDIELAEPGARADVFGLLFASTDQHIDSQVRIDHQAPHTSSVVASRGLAEGNGRGVFCGKVVVRPGAQRIDARQSSDNLLLSEKAEIDTKPELEIYADDVKCSHGATIGELDENQLFYLRSRGMAEREARGLLTFAFANTALERIGPTDLRERAAFAVAGQLPDPVDPESLR